MQTGRFQGLSRPSNFKKQCPKGNGVNERPQSCRGEKRPWQGYIRQDFAKNKRKEWIFITDEVLCNGKKEITWKNREKTYSNVYVLHFPDTSKPEIEHAQKEMYWQTEIVEFDCYWQ